MELWQFFAIVGVVFLVLELFAPMLFFLNFGISGLVSAVVAVFFPAWNILIPVFVTIALLLLFALRPFLAKAVDIRNGKSLETGVQSKYIGQVAKVIEHVSQYSGAISIYGERWEARSEKGVEFALGSEVKIVKNESLVMFVEGLE